jgi:thiol-disulfide isomerase/thioredoxin
MKTIHSLDEYQAVVDNPQKSVVLWSANWCADCMFIKPFMPAIEEKFSDFTFYMADRDELLDLAIDLKILGIPSFLTYENGKETNRFVSKLRKTQQEIEDFLEETRKKGE